MPLPEAPLPQDEPFEMRVKEVVLVVGWQVEQALVGLGEFAR
jgi:hypothetical protein